MKDFRFDPTKIWPIDEAVLKGRPSPENRPNRGRNLYCCDTCGMAMITLEVINGFTPAQNPCVFEHCKGVMHVSDYKVPPSQEHAYEWYRPSCQEYHRLSREAGKYVREGGLLLRKRSQRVTSAVRRIAERAVEVAMTEMRGKLRLVTGGKAEKSA